MDSSVRQLNVAYDEQVVRVPTQKPRSIKHYCRGSLSYRPPSLGAESLFTKAMRKVLSNSSRLSTFVLKHYSEHQLQMIYDAAFKHQCLTIHLWQALVEAGLKPKTAMKLRLCQWYTNGQPLHLSTMSAISGDSGWLTHLTLSDVPAELFDMDAISEICNLSTMHFHWQHHARVPLNIRILRSWAEQAREGKAFRQLKLLSISGVQEIYNKNCSNLLDFPVLDYLLLNRCSINKYRKIPGWRRPTESVPNFQPTADELVDTADIDTSSLPLPPSLSSPHKIHREVSNALELKARIEKLATSGSTPRLHLDLGPEVVQSTWHGLVLERDKSCVVEQGERAGLEEEETLHLGKKRKVNAGKAATAMDLMGGASG